MVDPFDPYRTWLGIPPEEQPPDHYRLLGIPRFERDRVAIETAMVQRIASLEAVKTAEHAQARLKLILEIRGARSCLLNENRRRVYDLALERAEAAKTAQAQPPQEELTFAPLEGERTKPSRPPQQPEPAAAERLAPSAPPPEPDGTPLPPPIGSAMPAAMPPGSAPPMAGRSLLDEELAEHFRKKREQALLDSMSRQKGWRKFFIRQRGNRTTIWGWPLLLAVGWGLLVLALLGFVLLQALGGKEGDDFFQQANDAYRAGNYAQAITRFDECLRRFPEHSGVGLARVRRGLARLRQAAAPGANWPRVYQTANAVLRGTSPLPEFKLEAPPVLGWLLCDIAEGLVAEAQQRSDPALLEQAQESLTLLNKYVPKSRQPAARIGRIEASLISTRQAIAQPRQVE